MEREATSCQALTPKSFRRRMEERSELLKKTRGIQKIAKGAIKERTTFHAVDELDNLHRKWRDEQFHFDHRDESIEERDEDVTLSRCHVKDSGSREHASDTSLPTGTSVQSNLKSARIRRRVRVSFDDKCKEDTGPLHEQKSNKSAGAMVVSNVWKEKQLDLFLENMIQKIQKKSDSKEKGCKKSDKRKEEKRKKLLALLYEIQHKMSEKAGSVNILPENKLVGEKFAFSALRDNPSVSPPFQFTSPSIADTLEATVQAEPRNSVRTDNKESNSADIDGEYAIIPKEIITEMQKLLCAHRHADRSRKGLGRSTVRRLPTTSILDAIPENESIAFEDKLNRAKEVAKLTSKKIKGKDERLRRVDKQRHAMVDDMVDRSAGCFACGMMSDLLSPPRKSGSYIQGSR